jgi:hypothetical protein
MTPPPFRTQPAGDNAQHVLPRPPLQSCCDDALLADFRHFWAAGCSPGAHE